MGKGRTLGAVAGAGAILGAYSFIEPFRFRLVRKKVPVQSGVPPLTVLHISDTHLSTRDRLLKRFLASLPDRLGLVPDIVSATGDFIEDTDAIEDLVDLLSRIEARVGRYFVYGSHDYFVPTTSAYTKYFTGAPVKSPPIRRDETRMTEALEAKGWRNVINRTEIVSTERGVIRIAGVDDPYLDWHRTEHIERRADEVAAIALVHAPDVVSEWMLNGFDLVMAGHTHAGQVRIPGIGALVTNSSLPVELASGLTQIGRGWLHVSPGLGTGRYTPIRFNARPEATLLYLEPPR